MSNYDDDVIKSKLDEKLAKKQENKKKSYTISPKSFIGTSPPPGKHRPRKK